jgi:hypothetical protein
VIVLPVADVATNNVHDDMQAARNLIEKPAPSANRLLVDVPLIAPQDQKLIAGASTVAERVT